MVPVNDGHNHWLYCLKTQLLNFHRELQGQFVLEITQTKWGCQQQQKGSVEDWYCYGECNLTTPNRCAAPLSFSLSLPLFYLSSSQMKPDHHLTLLLCSGRIGPIYTFSLWKCSKFNLIVIRFHDFVHTEHLKTQKYILNIFIQFWVFYLTFADLWCSGSKNDWSLEMNGWDYN
jgi:hypothetical protein